jgi:DNA-binding transcriptional regulator YdaS (Cro superfamily)
MSLKAFMRTLSAEQKRDFALRCQASLSHLKFVAYGAKQPSGELAVRIEEASEGLVRAESLRPDIPWHVVRNGRSAAA